MKKLNFNLNDKVIKGLGLGISLLGAGLSLLSNWLDDKKLDAKIDESVAKAITEQQTNN